MIETKKNSKKYEIINNKNFINNQHYISEGKSFKLLNYYAFNNQGKKILFTTYLNMEKYLNKKLKDFGIISFILLVVYFILPSFIFNIFLLFYILMLYSFIFFIFGSKRYRYKYFLDKDIYIIVKKRVGYNFDYLNNFIKVNYDRK